MFRSILPRSSDTRIRFGVRFARIRGGTFVSWHRGEFVARSACNDGFVSILTLYHRRTSPEISNRPREFAWELWERHDKHQTQEYPMYALAYCAGEARGVFRARSRGRAKGKERDKTIVDIGVVRGRSARGVRRRRYRDPLCSQSLSIVLRRTFDARHQWRHPRVCIEESQQRTNFSIIFFNDYIRIGAY